MSTTDFTADATPTARCYDCFRPRAACFCAAIPAIDNRTEVLILQHKRERFHPFNSARIVRRALARSRVIVGSTDSLGAALMMAPRAALLYPGDDAAPLSELSPADRPEQLVVLDGTWHHAKTMVRDIPALARLPRYRLSPTAPSLFRIRREPNAEALSTLEAVVAALRELEPETTGGDQLLAAFSMMIDRQVPYLLSRRGPRVTKRKRTTEKNIPSKLLGDLSRVVVAYGESAPREPGRERDVRPPLTWAALRLGTGEGFGCLIEPSFAPDDELLRHLELPRNAFAAAIAIDEARRRWTEFLRPDDVVTVFNTGTARLVEQLSPQAAACLTLKSVDFRRDRNYATLDEIIAGEELTPEPPAFPGRTGKRLVNLAAFVQHLNTIGRGAVQATN
jgi:DTW domain-containing protein YfiP